MSAYRSNSNYVWFWNLCVPFVRFWGILTAVVICGLGVDVFLHHDSMGVYIIAASFIILFLEITWAITLFINVCVHNLDSKIFSAWNIILKIKFWKKSVIYSALSVALFLEPRNKWLSTVAGAMLVTLAFFHLILSFRTQGKNKGEKSLLQNEDNCRDRKKEVVFEVLDNTVKSKEDTPVEEPGGNVLEI